jgi:hypothetical protein
VKVVPVNAGEVVQACGMLYDAVDQDRLRHLGTPRADSRRDRRGGDASARRRVGVVAEGRRRSTSRRWWRSRWRCGASRRSPRGRRLSRRSTDPEGRRSHGAGRHDARPARGAPDETLDGLRRRTPTTRTRGRAPRWRPGMGYYDALYEGDHELGFATAAYWEAFGPYLAERPTTSCRWWWTRRSSGCGCWGFRFGKATGADEATWEIWQANDMDLGSDQIHREAGKLGVAYWMVDRPPAGRPAGDHAGAAEPGDRAVLGREPAGPRVRAEEVASRGREVYCNLYTPDEGLQVAAPGAGRWSCRRARRPATGSSTRARRAHHGIGEVPVVPVPNTPPDGRRRDFGPEGRRRPTRRGSTSCWPT